MTQTATTLAHTIAGFWQDILRVDHVAPDDDFIGLGGDSIRATMLANRIEDELGVRPEIAELFTTLAEVTRLCQELLAAGAA